MSAKYDEKDSYMISKGVLDPYSELLLCNMFDEGVDKDIKDIEVKLFREKITKRLALLRILTFPIKYPFERLFVSKLYSNVSYKIVKICINLCLKRITVMRFIEQLNKEELNYSFSSLLKEKK